MTPDLSAFGSVTLRHPLPGGHRNAVWLVEGPQGPAVAKSTRHGEAALRWLEPLQRAAMQAGFGVPQFYRTASGNIQSNGWTVEGWIPGPSLALQDMPALAPALHRFHRICPALPQRPGMAALTTAPLSDLPPDIATLCQAALMPFVGHATHPIHGDITASNLIHTATGPALIDWDEARCDLPFLDFIHLSPRNPTEIRAHLAGEILSGWHIEPLYAKNCANRLAHL